VVRGGPLLRNKQAATEESAAKTNKRGRYHKRGQRERQKRRKKKWNVGGVNREGGIQGTGKTYWDLLMKGWGQRAVLTEKCLKKRGGSPTGKTRGSLVFIAAKSKLRQMEGEWGTGNLKWEKDTGFVELLLFRGAGVFVWGSRPS